MGAEQPHTHKPITPVPGAVQVTFGAIFDGEARSRTVFLHNNSPTPLKFGIELASAASMAERRHGDNSDGASTADNPHAAFVTAARARAQALDAAVADPFDISPRSGEVAAFARVPLTIEYAPVATVPEHGFKCTEGPAERMHRFVAAIDTGSDTNTPHMLPLFGTALAKAVAITPASLTFGDVPGNEHRHLNCEVRNVTAGQAVRYRARATVPHFRVDPPEATIAPQATQFLAVIFHPRALGSFEGKAVLDVLNASGGVVAQQTIAVRASSNVVEARSERPGGVNALPEDFALPVKLATEEEVAKTILSRPPKFKRPDVRLSPLAWSW